MAKAGPHAGDREPARLAGKEEHMRSPVIRSLSVLFIGWFVTLATDTGPAWPQTELDPQSLVGEWVGRWTEKHVAKSHGSYYLWIEKVEGNKVYGRGEIAGRRSTEFKLVGTLDSNRLTFGKNTITELLIAGDQMRGSSQGRTPLDITLSRKK